MKTKVYNIKRSIITISCILFSIGAMAQANSSGGGSDNLQILFNLHGSEIDSLHYLLNNSSHTDTCFVKGILGLFDYDIQCCMIVQPTIIVNKIGDFYFKQ